MLPDDKVEMTAKEYWLSRPRITCRAFVEKDGKYLTIFAPWCERWTLPGGGLEGYETAEATLARELREELGITIEHPRFLGFSHGKQYSIPNKAEVPKLHLIFHVRTTQEVTIDESEASQHQWVTLDKLRKLELEDGITDFLTRYPGALR